MPIVEYYDLEVDWSVRLTWSGTFVHSAPWSEGSQGNANVSHGCINLSDANGGTYYELARYGDLVTVTNSTRDASDLVARGDRDGRLESTVVGIRRWLGPGPPNNDRRVEGRQRLQERNGVAKSSPAVSGLSLYRQPSLADRAVAVHLGIWTRFSDSRHVARDAYTRPAGRSTGFRRLSSVGQSDAFVMRRSSSTPEGGSSSCRSAVRAMTRGLADQASVASGRVVRMPALQAGKGTVACERACAAGLGPRRPSTAPGLDGRAGESASRQAVERGREQPGVAWTPGTQALPPDAVPAWRPS